MVRSGPTSDEVDRLHQVYAGYGEDPSAQRRWSESNQGNQAMRAERATRVRGMLRAAGRPPLGEQHVLELGCGSGQVLIDLVGPSTIPGTVIGLDLSEDRLRSAGRSLPLLPFVCAEGSALPFRTGYFDVVLAFTVFSSVLDDQLARHMADEIGRVLRPGGALLWYDLRWPNPWNRHTRAWRRRAVDDLFSGFTVVVEPITVLPPLARRLGSATERVYPRLGRVRALTSHYLGVIAKPS